MTRKDYKNLAGVLAGTIDRMALLLADCNPRFSHVKFFQAIIDKLMALIARQEKEAS